MASVLLGRGHFSLNVNSVSFQKETARFTINLLIIRQAEGQIKPKADWRAVDSPKKRTNQFVLP